MNLLLIHQAFVSPHEAGGTRHFEFGKYCVAHGIAFSIIASEISYLSGNKVNKNTGSNHVEVIDGVKIFRAKVYSGLHDSFVSRVISFFSFMVVSALHGLKVEKPDIVMGTTPPIFQAVSAWFVSAVRRRPFLLEVRDLWPEFAIDMGILKNPMLIWLSRSLENFLYSRADHLLVNSPAYREYLLKKNIDRRKISLISNGVDCSSFENVFVQQSIRQEYNLKDEFLIVYAGALGIANDIPVILKAAEQLIDRSEIHFLLIGDGKERNNLQQYCSAHQLKNVTFAGTRPKQMMAGILSESDACLAILQNIPMFRTTYPNKVFDYMAAGKPTVLAIDGVIRDVIESAGGGIFVQPGNVDALVTAIRWMADHRIECVEMGRSAQAYVRLHFDRKHHAKAFVDLVRTMSTN